MFPKVWFDRISKSTCPLCHGPAIKYAKGTDEKEIVAAFCESQKCECKNGCTISLLFTPKKNAS